MKFFALPFLLLIFCISCSTRVNDSAKDEIIDETELAINVAVNNAYAILTFDKNTPANSEGIRDMFVPHPNFINFKGDSLVQMSINELVKWHKEAVVSDEIKSFHEIELWGKTEYFGNIAHRISTYATYINTMDSTFDRGVNSFQLVKIDGKWLVNSIIWNIESKNLPIPAKYLNKQL